MLLLASIIALELHQDSRRRSETSAGQTTWFRSFARASRLSLFGIEPAFAGAQDAY